MKTDRSYETVLIIHPLVVAPGTTFNGTDSNVAIINNRLEPIEVTVYARRPLPPLPTCTEFLDIDADDCCTISCEKHPGHGGPHRERVKDNTVLWFGGNDDPEG